MLGLWFMGLWFIGYKKGHELQTRANRVDRVRGLGKEFDAFKG